MSKASEGETEGCQSASEAAMQGVRRRRVWNNYLKYNDLLSLCV